MTRTSVSLLLVCSVFFTGGCKTSSSRAKAADTGVEGANSGKFVWLNTWNPDSQTTWYSQAQGSQMLSWDVFMALEAADSTKLFASREHMEPYGYFYPDAADAFMQADPRLPVGFVKDHSDHDQHDYLSLNCSACHTGQYTYKDQRLLIHGGGATHEVDQLLVGLKAAIAAQKEPEKMARFTARIAAAPGQPSAADRLEEAAVRLASLLTYGAPDTVYGPGRMDADGWIANTIAGAEAEVPANRKPLRSPVRYPHMWRVPDLECVQTSCWNHNPLLRNIGEALGVFGRIYAKEGLPLVATPRPLDLHKLEESLRTMKAPVWPSVLPVIDQAKAGRGKDLYQKQCASCHMPVGATLDPSVLTQANRFGRQLIKVTTMNYKEVGTDPTFSEMNDGRFIDPGLFAPLVKSFDPSMKDPHQRYPINSVNLMVVSSIVQRFASSAEFATEAARRYPQMTKEAAAAAFMADITDHRDGDRLVPQHSYKARPLDGIAFTGPYLHNGSVPTLWDLLQAPDQRPKAFKLGTHAYDPVKVGTEDSGAFVYDTTQVGNSNLGHTYGTSLSVDEKWDLVEYMKTI